MGKKILIVEDDDVLRSAYELILKKEGYNVEAAHNGKEGIEKAEAFGPAIILLDILMPVMDGLQFLELYNSEAVHPNTKIIILSNLGDEEKVKKALDTGAYKYLVKSHTSPAQLTHIINRLAAQKK